MITTGGSCTESLQGIPENITVSELHPIDRYFPGAQIQDMTKTEILDELSDYTGSFPREAVEAASVLWDEIGADMVAALEEAADRPEEVAARNSYMLHTYAMFLCAEKRDRRAFEPLLRILSIPDENMLDILLGDTLTEEAASILASVYPGDVEPILALIENPGANEYARSQGVKTLKILWAHGMLERSALVDYLGQLMEHRVPREPSNVWNTLAWSAAEIGATELLPQVRRIYAEELVDEIFAPVEVRLEQIEEEFAPDADTALERIRKDRQMQLIDSALTAMEWWDSFREKPLPQQPRGSGSTFRPSPDYNAFAETHGGTVRRETPKVGRNEPCPCGSGRKYKQCCGR